MAILPFNAGETDDDDVDGDVTVPPWKTAMIDCQ